MPFKFDVYRRQVLITINVAFLDNSLTLLVPGRGRIGPTVSENLNNSETFNWNFLKFHDFLS